MQASLNADDSASSHQKERIAFVLIDGLGDIHIPALASLTPLEAADTPVMDAIAGVSRLLSLVNCNTHVN